MLPMRLARLAISSTGTEVTVDRRVYTTMVPQGFEEFMYFTDVEEPIGPGNTELLTLAQMTN